MDDERIWNFERELWTGGADVYREKVADDCVMALPTDPFVMDGKAATEAVSHTPRWESVSISHKHVSRPEHGLIVIAYRAEATRESETYRALCTSTLGKIKEENWEVMQHQQAPLGIEDADPDA